MNEPSIYMDLDQVLHHTRLKTTAWYGLVAKGEAPKPRQLSSGRVAWLRREIEAWAESRPVSELPPPANAGKGATAEARARRGMANETQQGAQLAA